MAIPYPFPYQGSKRNLAKTILQYLPKDTNRLVESFAGAVSLAAAYGNRAASFVLNDINQPLMQLWTQIIYFPDRLADQYEELWDAQNGNEKDFYFEICSAFNKTHEPDYFLYLLARCVKAAIRYNANGDFNQSPDNRRKGMLPQTLRKQIKQVSQLLKGRIALSSTDFQEVVAAIQANDIVYFDPPYQGVSQNRDSRYVMGIEFEQFVSALHCLNEQNVSFIVSYDGKTGVKTFGKPLPKHLWLHHIEIDAGRSAQATLLGRHSRTYESLYLSRTLLERLPQTPLLINTSEKAA